MSANILEHFENFLEKNLPGRKDEDWKYLNLKELSQREFQIIDQEVNSDQIPQDYKGDFIIFGNQDISQSKLESQSIKIETTEPKTIKLDKKFSFYNPFHNLDKNIRPQGYKISVKPSSSKQSLLILHPGIGFSTPYIEMELAKNAELELIEIYQSTSHEQGFHSPVLKVDLLENSQLDYIKICQENHKSSHLGSLILNQSQDSQVHSHHVLLGGDICRQEIIANLNGKNSSFNGNGLYLAHDQQQHDIHAIINHFSDHAQSELNYKGIANHQGKAIFNGRVVVHPGADFSVAHQKNSNLLLSNKAEINPKPDLEIYADEVECSHGATVGRLDERALFYLKSRGISEKRAEQILIQAFIQESIDKIPLSWIRELISRALQEEKVLS